MISRYCTYFDEHYFPQGMAMVHSLKKHQPTAHFTVLCLSSLCEDLVRAQGLKDLEILTLCDLETRYPELVETRQGRTKLEYYFTCTPFLLRAILEKIPSGELLTYLDADLSFFSDPAPIVEEIGTSSVAIIPHRFPRDLEGSAIYGLYNVGWVTFRNDGAGRACLDWWAAQCKEWCYNKSEDGKFADQKYLDDFPTKFTGVHIIQNPGANLAPWNIRRHQLSKTKDKILVDAQLLIFFHYHGFKFEQEKLTSTPFAMYHTPYTSFLKTGIVKPWLKSLKPWRKLLLQKKDVNKKVPTNWKNLIKPLRNIVFDSLIAKGSDIRCERLQFIGNYESWAEAQAKACGYEAPHIFEKTRESMRKIVSGEAVFERDSFLMDVPEYPFSTISGLLLAATQSNGKFNVLDFGGSLGSTYFACRPWLDRIEHLHWSVVEQAHYVECGRQEFTTARLSFYSEITEAVACHPPDIILLSGSLHFLPNAFDALEKICLIEAPYLLLERTPFCEGTKHGITVQHVPPDIYPASYPCWLFNEARLLEQMNSTHKRVCDYPALDVIPWDRGNNYFKGMLFRKK